MKRCKLLLPSLLHAPGFAFFPDCSCSRQLWTRLWRRGFLPVVAAGTKPAQQRRTPATTPTSEGRFGHVLAAHSATI